MLACTSSNNLIVFAMGNEIRTYDRKAKQESVFIKYSGNTKSWKDEISQIEISEDDKTLFVFLHAAKKLIAYSLQTKQKVLELILKEDTTQPSKCALLQNKNYVSYWWGDFNEIYDIHSGRAISKQDQGKLLIEQK